MLTAAGLGRHTPGPHGCRVASNDVEDEGDGADDDKGSFIEHLLCSRHFIFVSFHLHSKAILEERKPRLREMKQLDHNCTALRGEAGSEDPKIRALYQHLLHHPSPVPVQ